MLRSLLGSPFKTRHDSSRNGLTFYSFVNFSTIEQHLTQENAIMPVIRTHFNYLFRIGYSRIKLSASEVALCSHSVMSRF